MGLDRSVHSDETADGVTLPVAPGTVVRGGLAQKFTPPDFWPRLAGGKS